MCDIVVKKFTFAISSPDEFLLIRGDMAYRIAAIPMTLSELHSKVIRLLQVFSNVIFL